MRDRADRFLAEHHPAGTIPVPIEDIVDLRFQIDIIPTPGLHEHFGVDAFLTSDLTAINVDEFVYKSRPGRYRFSLAHEMGHFILHSHVYKQLSFSTIDEWIAAMAAIPEKEYGFLEWQAYEFAGLILVPAKPLAEAFERMAAHLSSVGLSLQTQRMPPGTSSPRPWPTSLRSPPRSLKNGYKEIGYGLNCPQCPRLNASLRPG